VALVLALFGVLAWDFVRPYTGSGGGVRVVGSDGVVWDLLDTEPRVEVAFTPETRRFGIALTKEQDPYNKEDRKKLTYAKDGRSNNTCVRINGAEYLFGDAPPGRWVQRFVDQSKLRDHRREWKSVMEYPNDQVRVTQLVSIVPGGQSRLLDTVLVRYIVENYGTAQQKVGLRVLLDTYIGAEDGVPFLIPGQTERVDTMKIIGAKDMPDFIEALESYSLKNPGTVAQLGLRIAGSEDLQKLVICRHPELKFGLNAKWEWEYTPMNQPRGQKPDSCVVLYWAEEMMPAGATRVMAFTYGLGTISSTGGDSGNLAVTLGGSFQPGRVFTVTGDPAAAGRADPGRKRDDRQAGPSGGRRAVAGHLAGSGPGRRAVPAGRHPDRRGRPDPGVGPRPGRDSPGEFVQLTCWWSAAPPASRAEGRGAAARSWTEFRCHSRPLSTTVRCVVPGRRSSPACSCWRWAWKTTPW
jgi:hypothetical protein